MRSFFRSSLFVLALVLAPHALEARDLASLPLKTFVARSELVVIARLVRAEEADHGIRYVFRVEETLKGPKILGLDFRRDFRETFPPLVGTTGILFLRRAAAGKWQLSVDERSFWPYVYLMKPDFHTLKTVRIPDTLVRDIPRPLKKPVQVKVPLPNGYHHQLQVAVYHPADVLAFLKRVLAAKK